MSTIINTQKIEPVLSVTADLEVELLKKLNKMLSMYKNVSVRSMKDLERVLYKVVKKQTESWEEIVNIAHAYMMIVQTLDNYIEKKMEDGEIFDPTTTDV